MRGVGKGLGWLVLLVLVVSASAASAKIYDRARHWQWESMILTSKDDVVTRIATEELDPKSHEKFVLAVDFPPQQCSNGSIALIACAPGMRRIPPQQGRAQIRVDSLDVIDADINVFMNSNSCAVVSVSNTTSELVNDAMRGTVIRFKLQIGESTLYRKFSLLGFTDAYTRSRQLCQVVKDALAARRGEDERHFEPEKPRQQTPNRPGTPRPNAPEAPGEISHF